MTISLKRCYRPFFKRLLRQLKPLWGAQRSVLRKLPMHRLPPSAFAHPRPGGYHLNTSTYLNSGQSNARDRSLQIYSSEVQKRELPICLAGDLPPHYSQHLQAEIPAAEVNILHEVRFWGYYGGTVIGRDNKLIADLSPDVWTVLRHRALGSAWLPPAKELDGTIAIVSTAEAESNYWHWMMDALPRFHLLNKAGYTPEKIDWYITNAKLTSFQLETLAALGIPKRKIVVADGRTHLQIRKAVIPSIRPASWDVPSWVPPFLRGLNLIGEQPGSSNTKLYLARSGEKLRQLKCEPALVEELQKRGFNILFAGRHSVAEQQLKFSQAGVVLAPHGAALTNLVFCKPGTLVFDLMSSAWPQLHFWALSEALGLRYTVLFDTLESNRPVNRSENICLPLDSIIAAIDSIR